MKINKKRDYIWDYCIENYSYFQQLTKGYEIEMVIFRDENDLEPEDKLNSHQIMDFLDTWVTDNIIVDEYNSLTFHI